MATEFCWTCYHFDPTSSSFEEKKCRCERQGQSNETLICCNITSPYLFKEGRTCGGLLSTYTKHVYICNSSLEYFEAGLSEWNHLETLTLVNSSVKKVIGQFEGTLRCINLSASSLKYIEPKAFQNLPNLKQLDLSKNNITKLPELLVEGLNITLDISGNLQLECHSLSSLVGFRNYLSFIHRNTTFCRTSQSFHWFNSTSLVSLEQVELLQGVQFEEDCPKGKHYQCNCRTNRFELVKGKPTTVSIRVDCSGQNLTELPPKLPPNTSHLDVSNNNITSLDPLISEPSYSDITVFLADNNKINSITSLERSQFIDKLITLSIRRNNLKSIPIYILSNTFDRNWEGRFIKLGGNKLNCDCNTAQVLKLWLLTNKAHIPDYKEVLCEKDLEKVIDLDQSKVCVYPKDWTDYIYYIIAAEVFLLLLLISKVSYDYWVFKTSGYLPWPASKMPKLPCDWVFET
ncbi:leucine-rich repeat domain-containing protein hfw isoform X3 [Rhodnius prolixus]|uniref:leucine-rich repeat domain-containing protein hfw isoform X2 n=1 Tax=Rhodnius prolixus TaxID=13249 RepID=UPI003D187824